MARTNQQHPTRSQAQTWSRVLLVSIKLCFLHRLSTGGSQGSHQAKKEGRLQARHKEESHILPDIQFTLVYEVDLRAPALDDFSAFAEFLLISGRSPATVQNYLSVIKILLQEWQVKEVVKDLSSPAWNLTLRAISYLAGHLPDHRSAVTTCHWTGW